MSSTNSFFGRPATLVGVGQRAGRVRASRTCRSASHRSCQRSSISWASAPVYRNVGVRRQVRRSGPRSSSSDRFYDAARRYYGCKSCLRATRSSRTWGSSTAHRSPLLIGPPGVRFVGPSVAPATAASRSSRGARSTTRPGWSAPRCRRVAWCPATTWPSSGRPVAAADHHHPGLLAGRAGQHGAAAADAHGLARRVHRITRARIRHGDAKLRADRRRCSPRSTSRAPGDPPIEPMAAVLPGSPSVPQRRAAGDPRARSRAAGDPAVHQRLDQRAEGRDDPRPGAGRQHRRVVRGGRARPTTR